MSTGRRGAMDFQLIDITNVQSHLVVTAEHYHPDGSFWFRENYVWQGREGLKRKRKTDAEGRILMDDGQRAPLRLGIDDELVPYLPSGRTWARLPAPHMDEESILTTMRSIHQQRLISGWPQGRIDKISRISESKIRQEDRDGCPILIAKFAALKGLSV